jgi:hypothetical protein
MTVYHGPVKRVEEYFTGLGIVVPRDMLSPGSESLRGSTDHSSVGEDAKDRLGQKKDEYDYNKTSEDLSNRSTPGILRQYRYFLGR